MVAEDDGAALESRPPTLDDLIDLCRRLNEEGAEYVVIGGMAILQLGFVRATEDIDLLVGASPENFERLRRAMLSLPDQAIEEVRPTDLDEYVVVRVADEFVVDLMKSACGIDYQEARSATRPVALRGVTIPFASAELLWKLKQTVRSKDEIDRQFLARLLEEVP
jgi:hypothetical protein